MTIPIASWPLVLVAAVARNGVIGRDNQLPWRLPSDLRRFKAITLGKPLIMGRRTFESIGRPLPGRQTIVVTRNLGFTAPGVSCESSFDAALAAAHAAVESSGAVEIIVAGGGEIFAEAIGQAAMLRLTEVDLEPPGDTLFPVIDPAVWRETARSRQARSDTDDADFSFVDYARR